MTTPRFSSTFLVALLCFCVRLDAQGSPATRDVSGTVMDAHHEPLKGAVVQLENEATEQVTTFVTDGDGHYEFKRVGTNGDYHLSASYRGHRSKTKELSQFSSKTRPFVRLVIGLR